MNYLDTSALIKRFVNEKGSSLAQSLVQQSDPVATATIAYAEVFSGLTRKFREKQLSKALHGLACRQFASEWPAYVRVELNEGILVLARDLIQRHPLRGFDAVHLASAVSLRNALGERITFVAALRSAKFLHRRARPRADPALISCPRATFPTAFW